MRIKKTPKYDTIFKWSFDCTPEEFKIFFNWANLLNYRVAWAGWRPETVKELMRSQYFPLSSEEKLIVEEFIEFMKDEIN